MLLRLKFCLWPVEQKGDFEGLILDLTLQYNSLFTGANLQLTCDPLWSIDPLLQCCILGNSGSSFCTDGFWLPTELFIFPEYFNKPQLSLFSPTTICHWQKQTNPCLSLSWQLHLLSVMCFFCLIILVLLSSFFSHWWRFFCWWDSWCLPVLPVCTLSSLCQPVEVSQHRLAA